MKILGTCFFTGLLVSTFLASQGLYDIDVEATVAVLACIPFAVLLFSNKALRGAK